MRLLAGGMGRRLVASGGVLLRAMHHMARNWTRLVGRRAVDARRIQMVAMSVMVVMGVVQQVVTRGFANLDRAQA